MVDLPYIHKLKYPVKYGEQIISEVKIERRPTVKDLRNLPPSSSPLDQNIELASRLIGEAPSFVNNIDAEDMLDLAEIASGFLESSRPAGRK